MSPGFCFPAQEEGYFCLVSSPDSRRRLRTPSWHTRPRPTWPTGAPLQAPSACCPPGRLRHHPVSPSYPCLPPQSLSLTHTFLTHVHIPQLRKPLHFPQITPPTHLFLLPQMPSLACSRPSRPITYSTHPRPCRVYSVCPPLGWPPLPVGTAFCVSTSHPHHNPSPFMFCPLPTLEVP